MEFVIITGMSGAGKTGALHVLEDIGYYCVDNLPSSLLSTLYRLCLKSEDDSMKRVAVVVDVRGNEKFEEMCSQIEHFKAHYENVKVLFFDAMTDRLVVRYKETRRRHPLSENSRTVRYCLPLSLKGSFFCLLKEQPIITLTLHICQTNSSESELCQCSWRTLHKALR